MEEKDGKLEERNNLINTKLTWETPKLYMLDKGKTYGGEATDLKESIDYVGS